MSSDGWRARAGTTFQTEKRPVTASRGVVVANHPLGAAAGAEMLAAGGNAVDATIAALFALTVVEPMMVGIFGAGLMHVHLADGTHAVLDGYTSAPAAATPAMYRPLSDTWPDYLRAEGDVNTVGPLAVGVPGTLKSWAEALARWGRFDLATVVQPAIRHAERGFLATAYLVEVIHETAADLARFPETARTFLPRGVPPRPGDRVVQPDYAVTLRRIADDGPDVLHGGALGAAIATYLTSVGGLVTLDDLRRYRTVQRRPVLGRYRGLEIAGAPPPTAGGIGVIQMLNLLEGFDVARLGFGTVDHFHLVAEALKLAFADRHAATGDPDFVAVPVEQLTGKPYADARRGEVRMDRAGAYAGGAVAAPRGRPPGTPAGEPTAAAHTTHVTAADADGNVVAATQTINSLFGSKVTVPGTGVLLNNNMALFDPHPGHPGSIAPGKRMTSSMAPTLVFRESRPVLALGLPGGVRIFPSVLQALVNLIDHGMTLQEAVEAPRVWTQGQELEVETGVSATVRDALTARGHAVTPVPAIGGGMNAIAIEPDGSLSGAACWRADGSPVGVSGGRARPGIRFRPEAGRR